MERNLHVAKGHTYCMYGLFYTNPKSHVFCVQLCYSVCYNPESSVCYNPEKDSIVLCNFQHRILNWLLSLAHSFGLLTRAQLRVRILHVLPANITEQ